MNESSETPPAAIPRALDANTAHELSQPLTAILGNAQAARRFINKGEISHDELLAIVDDIIRDTRRAAAIIRDLQARRPDPPPKDQGPV